MEKHQQHIDNLRFMMASLMEKQSCWHLTQQQRKQAKEGIEALQAAVDAMNIQVYA